MKWCRRPGDLHGAFYAALEERDHCQRVDHRSSEEPSPTPSGVRVTRRRRRSWPRIVTPSVQPAIRTAVSASASGLAPRGHRGHRRSDADDPAVWSLCISAMARASRIRYRSPRRILSLIESTSTVIQRRCSTLCVSLELGANGNHQQLLERVSSERAWIRRRSPAGTVRDRTRSRTTR